MAGRDASTQLGGMLSQIGNTLANRASAGQGLMSPIRNTFRPELDPNDPASLQQMAQFKTRIGETDQARMFMEQSRYQEAEQRRVREEQKAEKRLVASQQIARLQTQADAILANPALNPQQTERALQSLQNRINTVAEDGGVDPSIGYANYMNDAYNRNAATRMQDLNLSDAELRTMQQQARMDIARAEADLSAAQPGSIEAARLTEEIQTRGAEAGLPRQEWADPQGRITRENQEQRLAFMQSAEGIRSLEMQNNLRRVMGLPEGSEERAEAVAQFREKYPGEASERVLELERNYTSKALQMQELAANTEPFDFARDEDGRITGKSPQLESMLEGLPEETKEQFRRAARSSPLNAASVRANIRDAQKNRANLQLREAYTGEMRLADRRARLESGIRKLGETIGEDFDAEGFFGLNPLYTAMNERAKQITDEDRLVMTGLITSEFGTNAAFTSKQVAWAFATMLQDEQKGGVFLGPLAAVNETVAEMRTQAGGQEAAPIPEADDPPSPEYQAAQKELDLD